jgi:hypothetical protein
MYGEKERCLQGFWRGNLREGDDLEDPGIDGRIILRRTFTKWDAVMNCIDLAQDRDRWQALVNAVMNLKTTGSHKMLRIS